MAHGEREEQAAHRGCCSCDDCGALALGGMTRRDFLRATGVAVGGLTMSGLTWPAVAAAQADAPPAPARQELLVKPILTYEVPGRHPQTSWRSWGGIQTQEHARDEVARIQKELDQLKGAADFPVSFLPVSAIRGQGELAKIEDLGKADAFVIYAAGGGSGTFDALVKTGKHVLFFLRHKSGPVYLWYEIISPRWLRQHTDRMSVKGVDNHDVVVDSVPELTWRLRALCGLKNALGMKIVTIGGASGWACPKAPELSRTKWKLDIHDVPYPELAKLLKAAHEDEATVKAAKDRAEAYLKDPTVTLKTEKAFVENAFILEQVFKGLMAKAGARAITVNACMGTIMPISKTTACLTLSTLNDAGYLAFCESDFVVIPAGILLASISGRPHFLNDPTYPHDGVITLAHCTAPRRMDGKNLEPVTILTHFESDYGAAPKVEMKKGQKVTVVIPDFEFNRYVGFLGEIADVPFIDICRSQIDVGYKVPDILIADKMPGFHWELIYGDYLKETGYALKKIPIAWECLG